MTDFDTSSLLTSRTGFGAVADLLDSMRVRYKNFYDGSLESTTSSSFVELRSNNITGIVSTDLIIMTSTMNLSGDAAAMRIRCELRIGSTSSNELYSTTPGASTLGRETPLTMVHVATGESGTVACASWWQIQALSGGTTIYSDREDVHIFVFKSGGEL